MNLSEKYTPNSEKDNIANKNKKVLSDDAYAICEFIELLNKKLEHARTSLMK